MVTEPKEAKITYSTMSVEQLDSFNAAYEEALARVSTELGREYPVYISNEPVVGGRRDL